VAAVRYGWLADELQYGNRTEIGRHTGSYAGRILQGANPADLPVVQSPFLANFVAKVSEEFPRSCVAGVATKAPQLPLRPQRAAKRRALPAFAARPDAHETQAATASGDRACSLARQRRF